MERRGLRACHDSMAPLSLLLASIVMRPTDLQNGRSQYNLSFALGAIWLFPCSVLVFTAFLNDEMRTIGKEHSGEQPPWLRVLADRRLLGSAECNSGDGIERSKGRDCRL